jgi:hypothetical protein
MHFISHLQSILPHVSKEELITLYETCYPTCQEDHCEKDCIPEKSYCEIHVPCDYFIQSGKRKGMRCGVHHCKVHKGLIQCKIVNNGVPCLHRCESGTICVYHKKEEERVLELHKPILPIRIHESGYFIVKHTNIVVHIERNQLYGTLVKEDTKWVIHRLETDEIKKISREYQIPFYHEISLSTVVG